jgi:hypothetical protein
MLFWQEIIDFVNILLSCVTTFQISGRNSFYLKKATIELQNIKHISTHHHTQLEFFLNSHNNYLSNM